MGVPAKIRIGHFPTKFGSVSAKLLSQIVRRGRRTCDSFQIALQFHSTFAYSPSLIDSLQREQIQTKIVDFKKLKVFL